MLRKSVMLALLGLSLVSLAGCDAAEQSARDMASKAEQAAQELARETLKDSVDSLNQQLDKAQEKAETWIGQPPAQEAKPDDQAEPKAGDSAAATLET